MSLPIDVQDALDRLPQYNILDTDNPFTFVGPDGYGYLETYTMSLNDVAVSIGYWAGLAETLVVSPDSSVKTIVALTQAEYDALAEIDEETLYIIMAPA